ncbi:Uncharacterized protein Rs2_07598 [Raphanus sativus]|nr:Uncharacterized protein Rs2_07598 [Raphanus sativus]
MATVTPSSISKPCMARSRSSFHCKEEGLLHQICCFSPKASKQIPSSTQRPRLPVNCFLLTEGSLCSTLIVLEPQVDVASVVTIGQEVKVKLVEADTYISYDAYQVDESLRKLLIFLQLQKPKVGREEVAADNSIPASDEVSSSEAVASEVAEKEDGFFPRLLAINAGGESILELIDYLEADKAFLLCPPGFSL